MLRKITYSFVATNRIKKNLISISPIAAERIKELLANQNDPSIIGVKVGVKKRGCNGLSYTMNYCSQFKKLDEIIEENGVKVIVESEAIMVLVGTIMDYVEDDIKSEFVFRNPNEKGHCGCGESFHI